MKSIFLFVAAAVVSVSALAADKKNISTKVPPPAAPIEAMDELRLEDELVLGEVKEGSVLEELEQTKGAAGSVPNRKMEMQNSSRSVDASEYDAPADEDWVLDEEQAN
ncbi:MAG: hypothetical protein V4692_00880 [Bdellovibrionota bacterium]